VKLASVHSALRQHLTDWPDKPNQIVWQGLRMERPTDSPIERWVREAFKPSLSSPESIGPTPLIRTEGVYLLEVFGPALDGQGPVQEWADSLQAHFCPRTEIRYGGIQVTLLNASQTGGPGGETSWIRISLSINWRSDVPNPK